MIIDLIIILILLAVLALFVGLIKPTWLKLSTRGQVLKYCGGAAVVFFVAGIFLVPTPPENDPEVDAELAEPEPTETENSDAVETVGPVVHSYEIVQEQNTSFPGRERRTWSIVAPNAESQLDRAATVRQAALDLESQTGAEAMTVWMIMDERLAEHGLNYAMAHYIPDGCGFSGEDCGGEVWQISATDEIAEENQIRVAVAWDEHTEGFLDEWGLVDEEAYKPHLAEVLGIDESEVRFPIVTLDRIDQ